MSDITEPRQTGTTTRQMQAAPPGAVYVWPLANTHYATALAKHLGREDLQIICASSINSLRGRQPPPRVVIDHYTQYFLLIAFRNFRLWDAVFDAWVRGEEYHRQHGTQPDPQTVFAQINANPDSAAAQAKKFVDDRMTEQTPCTSKL